MSRENTVLRSRLAVVGSFALFLITLIVGPRFVINYIFGYVLIGLLLELAFLTGHFLLKLLLASRPRTSQSASRLIAAVVVFIETLIIAVLAILMLQSLRDVVDVPSLIFTAVVIIGLVVPTIFLWVHAVGFRARRV